MSNTNQFDWVDFYKELAAKLLQYKNNRAELISKVLKIYETTGINLTQKPMRSSNRMEHTV